MESLTERRLMREKEEMSLKFNNVCMENQILNKELQQWRKDYGELVLSNSATQRQLDESAKVCENFLMKLHASEQQVQKLNHEFGEKVKEAKILEKQNRHVNDELKECRMKCEEFERKNVELEKEVEEFKRREKVSLKEVEKLSVEKSEFSVKNAKLRRELNAVMAAANERFRMFETRLSELERVAGAASGDDDSDSGSQIIDNTQVMQDQERSGRLVGMEAEHVSTPIGENTASSPSIVELSSSDEDGELP